MGGFSFRIKARDGILLKLRNNIYLNDEEKLLFIVKETSRQIGMHAGAKPEIFRFAEKLRKEMTDSEIVLWKHLKLKPLGFKFRRQHPFNIYVLDFYCHKARMSIEIDGGYHLFKKQIEADKIRTENIKRLGVQEIRFSNEDVINNLLEVLKIIEVELMKIRNNK